MALLPLPPSKHKGILLMCVGFLVLFVFAAIYGDHGLAHLSRMQNEQRELEQRAFALQQGNERLRERAQRLRSDDDYIEKLAREHLGLAKKGEILYRVTPPTPVR
jgi:cell division protein FtsB